MICLYFKKNISGISSEPRALCGVQGEHSMISAFQDPTLQHRS